ncbi:MAG: hypothetical protein Hals2KO_08970 [Halioglobus sp.]
MRYPLAENFLQYFEVKYAVSPAELSQVFGIRYRVYCKEFGYEDASAFPNEEEQDSFDSKSLHALILHKSSGLPAGCVRLVMPSGVGGSDPLPFEENCADSLDSAAIDGLDLDRNTVCEISRLAVDTAFRRRVGEGTTRYGVVEGLDCSQQEQRSFALIAVTCFLAATALTEISGRTNVFAMMEPFLPRLLERSGIVFNRVGEDIDYHGLRAPYFITTQSALENMRPDLKELYCAVHDRIETGHNA